MSSNSRLDEARLEAERRLEEARREAETRLTEVRAALQTEVGFAPKRKYLMMALAAGAMGFAVALKRKRRKKLRS
jgi:vacuolar-type H+-ATPase subunit E/Vma4